MTPKIAAATTRIIETSLSEDFPGILLGQVLGAVTQILVSTYVENASIDSALQLQLQCLLSQIKNTKIIMDAVTYHRAFQRQLNAALDALMRLKPNDELLKSLFALKAELKGENCYTSPLNWKAFPSVRSDVDTVHLNSLNGFLREPTFCQNIKQSACLVQLLECILGYHHLAHTSSQWHWPEGLSLIRKLLALSKTDKSYLLYQTQILSLSLGLLTYLYPPERATLIDTDADSISAWSEHQQKDLVTIFQGLVELTYALKHERDEKNILVLLNTLEQLLLVSTQQPAAHASDMFDSLITGSYVRMLDEQRLECYSNSTNILIAQQQDSRIVSEFLSQAWAWTEKLLGRPIVNTALLLLGSTSRGERGQYSDIECALLVSCYNTLEEKAYIQARLRLLDVIIISLNQTPIMGDLTDKREGLRIDVSTVITDDPLHTPLMSVGTMGDFFEYQLMPIITGKVAIAGNANYFSLLYAKLIDCGEPSEQLYQTFKMGLQALISEPMNHSGELYQAVPLQRLTAWSIYSKILANSQDEWIAAKLGEKVSFKKLILTPLQYFSRFLELNHESNAILTKSRMSSHECLSALAASGYLPMGYCLLWIELLKQMSELRHSFDKKALGQCDKFSLSQLNIFEKNGITIVLDTILRPLFDHLAKQSEQLLPAPELSVIPLTLLKPFLAARYQLWKNMPTHWLLPILEDYPNEDGWNPRAANMHQRWQAIVMKTLISNQKFATNYLVQGGDWGQGAYYLKAEIGKQLFDRFGALRENEKYSSQRSAVHHVGDCFIKIYKHREDDGLISQQYMIELMHQRLSFNAIAKGYPLRFIVKNKGADKIYWGWVSETQPGITLEDLRHHTPDRLLEVDPVCYSEQVLFALITAQEDGHFGNFIERHKPGCDKTTWSCIDSGQAFVQSVRDWGADWKEALHKKSSYIVLKSLVFLIEQLLENPINRRVMEKVQLISGRELLKAWWQDVDQINKKYQPMVNETLAADVSKLATLPEFIALSPIVFSQVENTLKIFQNEFVDAPVMTHAKLLKRLDFRLAGLYVKHRQVMLEQGGIKKFNFATLEPAAYHQVRTPEGFSIHSSRFFTQVKALQQTASGLLNQIRNPITYFKELKFSTIVDTLGNPDKKRQALLLEMMRLSQLTTIEIDNCAILNERILIALIMSSPNLGTLKICHCPGVTLTKDIIKALQSRQNTLQMINLQLAHPNKKEDPLEVNLKSPHLTHLSLIGAHNATQITVDAPQLINATIMQSEQLNLLNLSSLSPKCLTLIGLKSLQTVSFPTCAYSHCHWIILDCPKIKSSINLDLTPEELAWLGSVVNQTYHLLNINHQQSIGSDILLKATNKPCLNILEWLIGISPNLAIELADINIDMPKWLDSLQNRNSEVKSLLKQISESEIHRWKLQDQQCCLNILILEKMLERNQSVVWVDLKLTTLGDFAARAFAKVIEHNQAMTKLNFSSCEITNSGAIALAKALRFNNTLTHLDLSHNKIFNLGAETLSESLYSNTTLKKLNLSWNKIGDFGTAVLMKSLTNNSALTHLDLQVNQMGCLGTAALSKALKTNKTLTRLDLGSNEIDDLGALALAKGLKYGAMVSWLDLSSNMIRGIGTTALAEALKSNMTLTHLDLSLNAIDDSGATNLANALMCNVTLTNLDLNSCRMGSAGIEKILQALKTNKTLAKLNLYGNDITDLNATIMAESLKYNKALKELNLKTNRMGDEGAEAIGRALELNTTLTKLNLDQNEISDFGGETLAKYLKTNQAVIELNLYENDISDSVSKTLVTLLNRNSVIARLNSKGYGVKDLEINSLTKILNSKTTLKLSQLKVGDLFTETLAKVLETNTTLKSFNFSRNHVNEIAMTALAKALERNTTLTTLTLQDDGITGSGTEILTKALTINTTLTALNLYSNKIGNSGANALANILKNNRTPLNKLNVSKNRIDDAGIATLVDALESNTLLSHLNLGENEISSIGIGVLAKAIENNTVLSYLNLYSTRMDCANVSILSKALKNNKTLTELNLSFNKLEYSSILELSKNLKDNVKLTNLNLQSNKIDNSSVDALGVLLKSNMTINTLNLSFNNISDSGAIALAEALAENTGIVKLDLSHNEISNAGIEALAPALKSNAHLTHLNLESNKISDAGVLTLANCLERNTKLSYLNLGQNKIGDPSIHVLANKLNINTTLNTLDLNSNRISDSGVMVIAKALENNSSLINLNLSWNKISNLGAEVLSCSLMTNTILAELNLLGNNISDIGLSFIVKAIEKNVTLVKLDLSNNMISDSSAKNLHQALIKNMTLTSLSLHDNNIDNGLMFKINKLCAKNTTHRERYFEAAQKGDLLTIKDMLTKNQVSPYGQNESGNTILHIAVEAEQHLVAEFLLKKYPTLEHIRNYQGELPAISLQSIPEMTRRPYSTIAPFSKNGPISKPSRVTSQLLPKIAEYSFLTKAAGSLSLNKWIDNWQRLQSVETMSTLLNSNDTAFQTQLVSIATLYGLQCYDVPGDGNCFFHAVFIQLPETLQNKYETAAALRESTVNHIAEYIETYRDSIDPSLSINKFIDLLCKKQAWSDQIIAQATSRLLNCHVVLLKNDHPTPIVFRQVTGEKMIVLGYAVGAYYQSLLPNQTGHSKENLSALLETVEADEKNPLLEESKLQSQAIT